jgi:hypothetical protein
MHAAAGRVNRTFHLADYFVDNTHDSTNRREYGLPDQIKGLFVSKMTKDPLKVRILSLKRSHVHDFS